MKILAPVRPVIFAVCRGKAADKVAKIFDRSSISNSFNNEHKIGWTRLSLALLASKVKANEIAGIKATYDLAYKFHQGQFRKDGITPFIGHPAKTTMVMIAELGVTDPVTIKAGLAHDLLEDTSVTEVQIEATSGKSALRRVKIVTKLLCEHGKELDFLTRILKSGDIEACILKVADRIVNIRSFRNMYNLKKIPAFARNYCEKTRRNFFTDFIDKFDLPAKQREVFKKKVLKELIVIDDLIREISAEKSYTSVDVR